MMVDWIATGAEPQRGNYSYRVKEGNSGPWIAAEPAGNPLRIVGTEGQDLNVGFNLRPGATIEQATQIARLMNDWIVSIELF
jgi:hypothetical protein